jgi:hypothetical protein
MPLTGGADRVQDAEARECNDLDDRCEMYENNSAWERAKEAGKAALWGS